MKKLFFFLLIIIVASIIIYYFDYRKHHFKDISREIMDTVLVMKNYPFVDFSFDNIPFYYQWKRQNKRCIWIYLNATNKEIEQLIEYPNPTVKAYAIYLLYFDKRDSLIFRNKLIEKYKSVEVNVCDADIIITKTIEQLINEFKEGSDIELQKVYKRKPK